MSKGLRWLLPLVAAFSLVAAACGGDGTENGDDEPTDATPTGTETTGEPAFTTIEEGILTVGSDIPYPPFEYRENGVLVGFDIDIMNEIASRLELTPEYIDTGFTGIFVQVATGSFDVVIAASTITPEREETVNFSDPYYLSQQSLTVATGSGIASTDDLGEGHVVGVQDGTTGEAWAEDNLTDQGVEIRAFQEGPDAYTALETGEVDAAINDEPTAIAEVALPGREGLEVVQAIDTGEAYGIAVDPNNEALLAAINEALADMIADGTYQTIFEKYPDLPPNGNAATTAA